MGASQSLGSALEGALDDAENLIVICSPAAAQSRWVDAEVRRFKRRGSARVFAVIAAGEPNSRDPNRECFPPSLKVRIDANGNPTGEPDEPRAPDLQREGMQRVRVELAAGLLNISFDALWQRDRRRARRNRFVTSAAALAGGRRACSGGSWVARLAGREPDSGGAPGAGVVSKRGRRRANQRSAYPPVAVPGAARYRELVEGPLRAMLGWTPDPYAALKSTGLTPARLRDATVLLDPGKGVYDVSDVGLKLERLIRSRDGLRLVAVGDQRVAVFDAKTGRRLSQVVNSGVQWIGHAFEAPSGLIVVTGAVLGPTNGSVWPYVLAISADGSTAQNQAIQATVFFGSAAGVTPACDALFMAVEGDTNVWRVERRELGAGRLGEPSELKPAAADAANSNSNSDNQGVTALAAFGKAFQTRDAFLGEAKSNPFTASGCPALALDDGFAAGALASQGAQVVTLEPVLGVRDEGPVDGNSRQRQACSNCVYTKLHRGSALSDYWRPQRRDLRARGYGRYRGRSGGAAAGATLGQKGRVG